MQLGGDDFPLDVASTSGLIFFYEKDSLRNVFVGMKTRGNIHILIAS